MPLMVGRCRSAQDACDEGIFHQRRLPAPKRPSAADYNGVLYWPNEAVALSGAPHRSVFHAPAS